MVETVISLPELHRAIRQIQAQASPMVGGNQVITRTATVNVYYDLVATLRPPHYIYAPTMAEAVADLVVTQQPPVRSPRYFERSRK